MAHRSFSLIRSRAEYIALVGSFILVGLETIIRVLTLALRKFHPNIKYPTNFFSIKCYFPFLSCVQATLQPIHIASSQEGRDKKAEYQLFPKSLMYADAFSRIEFDSRCL